MVNLCNNSKLTANVLTLKAKYQPINISGCDECIWHLIGDIKQSNKTLDQLKVAVLNISTGAAANDRLKYYNYTAHRLQVLIAFFLNNIQVA